MRIIDRLQKNPALSHLPVAGILLDLALICWAALLSLTTPWIVSHLRHIIPWVWIPQCLTLYAIVLGPDLPKEVNGAMALVRTILLMVGMGFIAVMGAVWVLISAMMLGIIDDSNSAIINIVFTFFAAPAAFFVAIARRYKTKRAPVEQMIRFLADHLAGDIYYKIHRVGHNLDRCRTQMKMIQSINAQQEEMNALADSVFKEIP